MSKTEYFCLLTVELKVAGGVEKNLIPIVIDLEDEYKVDNTEALFWSAFSKVVESFTRKGEYTREQINITDFKFWNNNLKEST